LRVVEGLRQLLETSDDVTLKRQVRGVLDAVGAINHPTVPLKTASTHNVAPVATSGMTTYRPTRGQGFLNMLFYTKCATVN